MAMERWPSLPYDAWKDTYATLHMWTQIVGKVALARAAPVNHSWGVALHVTARGLRTAVLRHGSRSFTIEFDFIRHELVIDSADGERRVLRLAPCSVADFYAAVMTALNDMQLPVRIWSMPVEIPEPIPFSKTETQCLRAGARQSLLPDPPRGAIGLSSSAAASSSASAAPCISFGEASILPSRAFRAGAHRHAMVRHSCAKRTRTKL